NTYVDPPHFARARTSLLSLPSLFPPPLDTRRPHSFPTRRSSDLADHAKAATGARTPVGVGAHTASPRAAAAWAPAARGLAVCAPDRKSTRLNSSHDQISYAVFCLKKKNKKPSITEMTHEFKAAD